MDPSVIYAPPAPWPHKDRLQMRAPGKGDTIVEISTELSKPGGAQCFVRSA